jgi:two-component system, chemotaxis family, protein-glutamate methylesterase/glutaminase
MRGYLTHLDNGAKYMAGRDVVVVGGSAGGIEALVQLVQGLPPDYPGSLFVVVHFPGSARSILPQILSRAGPLPARHAVDGETVEPGRIYVARPDCHLILRPGHMRLIRGPKENNARPALDPLFRSAARSYGSRVVGVVLSGNLNDGTAGLLHITRAGGITMVQSADTALYPGMPLSAIEHVAVDYVLPPAEMAEVINELALQPAAVEEAAMTDETAATEMEDTALADRQTQPGVPSTMACPECHGVLWETKDGELIGFRCRVGHAYSAEALLVHQSEKLEDALWTALRALEEHSALAKRMAARANTRGHTRSASAFTEQAMDAEHHAAVIRSVLQTGIRSVDAGDAAVAAAG